MATDQVLELIVRRAQDLAGAEQAFLAQPQDPDLDPAQVADLIVTASAGTAPEQLHGRLLAVPGSHTGDAFGNGIPFQTPVFDEGHGPALLLPLRSAPDTVSGVLVLVRPAGTPAFAEWQVRMITEFADQAALALKLADDQRQLAAASVFSDRDRIARDLHDHVIQRLFAHGLSLQSAQGRARDPAMRDRLSQMVDEVQDIITGLRTAIFDLHGGLGDGPGLRHIFASVIAEQTEDSGLRTTVRMAGPLTVIDNGLAEHAEAVLREALSNVVHHAQARSVTVTVSVGDDLTIDVIDDGAGIPKTIAGSGLHNLTVRAEQAGGTCTVTSADGGGTHLTWSAPLPDDAGTHPSR
ncbi:Redox sensor histidine kinase response regulator DevS [Rhodococcus opacus]|uniref:Redox sensor histidine kinase response regulator DevS n=1 Tax=Rhodococcus opacus TaxID=37919 RepID=A0A1B1KFG5_RHOOP|nr:GAF domain-containing sensor histidine kinase [Rhodococcus opacus]ANS31310.1 Redox sensor histidine kinase response regulator DevS [Rhodococcus opacus]